MQKLGAGALKIMDSNPTELGGFKEVVSRSVVTVFMAE